MTIPLLLKSLNARVPDLRAGQTFGRKSANQAVVRDIRYSTFHVRFDDTNHVVDLSTNGTYVNGRRLAKDERVEVKPGDLVTLCAASVEKGRSVFGDEKFAAWTVVAEGQQTAGAEPARHAASLLEAPQEQPPAVEEAPTETVAAKGTEKPQMDARAAPEPPAAPPAAEDRAQPDSGKRPADDLFDANGSEAQPGSAKRHHAAADDEFDLEDAEPACPTRISFPASKLRKSEGGEGKPSASSPRSQSAVTEGAAQAAASGIPQQSSALDHIFGALRKQAQAQGKIA